MTPNLQGHLRDLALLRTVQDAPKIIKQQLKILGTLLSEFIWGR